MITNPVEAKRHSTHICREILTLARYHSKEAMVSIGCNDFDEAKRHQDIVDTYIAMLECLTTLEAEEEL